MSGVWDVDVCMCADVRAQRKCCAYTCVRPVNHLIAFV